MVFYPPPRFAKAALKKAATSCRAATVFLSAALGTRRAKIAGRISFILSFCAKRKDSHLQIPLGSGYAGLRAQGAIDAVNNAASSGSQIKALGFAGGYLLIHKLPGEKKERPSGAPFYLQHLFLPAQAIISGPLEAFR